MAKYGMAIQIPGSIDDVKPQVQAALKAQGFGILTEIDVQKVRKEKIGADHEPFLFGARAIRTSPTRPSPQTAPSGCSFHAT